MGFCHTTYNCNFCFKNPSHEFITTVSLLIVDNCSKLFYYIDFSTPRYPNYNIKSTFFLFDHMLSNTFWYFQNLPLALRRLEFFTQTFNIQAQTLIRRRHTIQQTSVIFTRCISISYIWCCLIFLSWIQGST